MRSKIDSMGRIVIPKPLRVRLGLPKGADVELEERPEGLLMRRANPEPVLFEENGILVHTGKVPAGFSWDAFMRDERERRLREMSGL